VDLYIGYKMTKASKWNQKRHY